MSTVDQEPDQTTAQKRHDAAPTLRQAMASVRNGSWRLDPDEQITPASLQQGWHTTTGQVRSKGPRVLAVLAGVVLFAGIGAEVLSMNAGNQRFEAAQQEHDATIASLQADLSRVTSASANPTQQAASVRSKETAVRKAADQVARGQNAYAPLVVAAVANTSTADGASATPAEQAVAAHRAKLASAWSRQSLIVSGIAADSYSPSDPFTTAQVDPRWPWYVRYDAAQPSDGKSYGWVTDTVVVDASGQSASVLWRNLQRTSTSGAPAGTVLAWASATYDLSAGTFSDLTVTASTIGAAHLSPTLIYARYAGSNTGASSSTGTTSPTSVPLPALPTSTPTASSSPASPSTPASAAATATATQTPSPTATTTAVR